MEELSISTAAIVEHLLITCVSWLAGIGVGTGLGVLFARGCRALFSQRPEWRRLLVLLPWRTLVIALLMIAWSPFVVAAMGIGAMAGGTMVGVSVFLLALAFTAGTLVKHWHPSPLRVRLIAGARTLAVASALLAVGAGFIGGGGVGHFILDGVRLMQYDLMWKGVLIVLTLALGLDLLLGVAQVATLPAPP